MTALRGVARERNELKISLFLDQADIKTKKAQVQKQSATIKTRQNEVRTTELELGEHSFAAAAMTDAGIGISDFSCDFVICATEQVKVELSASTAALGEAKSALDKNRQELKQMQDDLYKLQVCIFARV